MGQDEIGYVSFERQTAVLIRVNVWSKLDLIAFVCRTYSCVKIYQLITFTGISNGVTERFIKL